MDSPHKEGSGSVKVLLIPPLLERNYEIFFKHFKNDFKKVFTFFIVKPIPRHDNGTVNYNVLLEQCRKLIIQENIGVVFANKQAAAMVTAVLCEEFKHIRGPTVESVFLCNHEYYKTAVVDTREHKLPYSLHQLCADKYDFAHHVLMSVKTPCLIRQCLGMGHSTYTFHNRDELLRLYNKCKLDTEHIVGMHQYLVKNFVDLKKYPKAAAHVVMINSVREMSGALSSKSFTKVHVEAGVFQKEIIPWSVCDVVTFQDKNRELNNIFSGIKIPSDLSEILLDKLWFEFKKDIQILIKYGMDYSFLHAEYDVYTDGFVHLVTLCVGPNVNNTKMYSLALKHGNNMEAALQISMGIRPQVPSLNVDKQVVVNHIMVVYESCKADNLIRFVNAKSNPHVWLRYLPGQDIIIEPARRSAILGIMVAVGNTVNECVDKIKTLRADNLKIQDLVPMSYQNTSP